MRQLFVIPIVHSHEDLGKLRQVATTVKSKMFQPGTIATTSAAVSAFWKELFDAIQVWDLEWSTTKIYQDALPFTGDENTSLIKLIVDDLAAQGSQNHRILQWLHEQGGVLLGSERPELLIEEYSLIKKSMDLTVTNEAAGDGLAELSRRQSELLIERDKFIAARIDKTLTNDGVGLVFLGMLHSLEDNLPTDISISYPFGKPSRVAIV